MARDVVFKACDEVRTSAEEIRSRMKRLNLEDRDYGLFASGMAYGIRIVAEVIEEANRSPRGSKPTRIRDVIELEPTLRYLAKKYSPFSEGGQGVETVVERKTVVVDGT